jgi:outer membrane protein assembly factor BamB
MTLVLLAAAGGAWAEDSCKSQSWAAGPGRNMVRPAENVPTELTDENLRWQVDSGTGHQYPMPAIAGDKVLIGGNGRGNPDPYWGQALQRGGSLVCRRLSDGKQLWRLVSPGTDRPNGFGVCGSPLVEGDRVYVLSVYDVYCLDLNGLADGNQGMQDELKLMTRNPFRVPEGKKRPTELPTWAADVIWHYSFNDMNIRVQDAVSCTPLNVAGQIWISTANEMGSRARGYWDEETEQYKAPPAKPHMIVLDKATGKLIATDQMNVPIVWHGEWSSPSAITVNGKTAVIFPDGYGVLHGLAIPEASPDAKPVKLEEYWTFDLNPREYRYDEKGREHPYSLDTRLTYKYPLGWIQDGEKWILPPQQWASYRSRKEELKRDFREVRRVETLRFNRHRARELSGPGKGNGPCEVIAMPVVVGDRIYLGIGRDFNYAGGGEAPDREMKPAGRLRRWGLSRFMCMEIDDVTSPPRIVWEDRQCSRIQSNASVHDGLVYVSDLGGFLNCYRADTGEVVYRYDLEASVRERSQMVADGKIYIANDKNEMLVLTAGPEPRELSRNRYRGHLSSAIAADGVLVFTTPRKVYVYGAGDRAQAQTE